RDDPFDDASQGYAARIAGHRGSLPPHHSDFRLNILFALEEDQPARCAEITIHRADPPADDAIDRHASRCRLAYHSSATAAHQVGDPDQIEAVHPMLGADDPSVSYLSHT